MEESPSALRASSTRCAVRYAPGIIGPATMAALRAGSQSSIVDTLLASDEPSIRWKTRAHVLGEDPASREARRLRDAIRTSPRVKALLSHRTKHGLIAGTRGVYDKWQGAHWILATLADLGYPEHDESLVALRNTVLDQWLDPSFYEEFEANGQTDAYKKTGVPIIEGRYRRCASQQGYALYFLLMLGLEDERADRLVERLMHWRWPDGGWNCDKTPSASKSSFIHTVHCMRALHLYGARSPSGPGALATQARRAAAAASEIFLSRRLYRRKSTGAVINKAFIQLHYPLYWHYDVLFALKVMAETGFLRDPRCHDALDLLEAKRLPDGGWPAESRYYKASSRVEPGGDWVDWGGTGRARMNPWVTVDALAVLTKAGRIVL